MTRPLTAYDILGNEAEENQRQVDSVKADLPGPLSADDILGGDTHGSFTVGENDVEGEFSVGEDPMHPRLGTHAPLYGTRAPDFRGGVNVVGAVDEQHTGPDAEAILNAAPLVPDLGTHEPDFGTGTPNFGDQDEMAPRDLDMLLDDEGDYGDEYPGDEEVRGVYEREGGQYAILHPSEDLPTWEEIEGAGSSGAQEIVVSNSRNFKDAAANRIAGARATVRQVTQVLQPRDWDLVFGPVVAPAGAVVTTTLFPQVLFKALKISATDTQGGLGTRIMQVVVGQKVQKPAVGNGSLTQFFAQNALANGISFDTAQRWAQIAVTVSFVQASTFDMNIWGQAVLDP